MAKKQTKRQRKFQAKGGAKGRLEKGIVLSKSRTGKKRKPIAQRSNEDSAAQTKRSKTEAPTDKPDRSDGLLSRNNLGDLDIDSFFQQFADERVPDDGDDDTASRSEAEIDADTAKDDSSPKMDKLSSNSSSDSESDGDEDDRLKEVDEEEDEEDIKAAERSLKDEMAKMKQSDPEFHDFLEENEKSLLQFGDDEDDEVDMDQEGADDVHAASGKVSQSKPETHLTPKLLASIAKGAFQQHSVKCLKRIIAAYRSACHLSDDADSDGKSRPGESGQKYLIDSSKVFDKLMLLCLNRCHKEFHHHLLSDEKHKNEKDAVVADNEAEESDQNKPINPKTLENSTSWSDLRSVLLSFFRSTLHVLADAKDPELLSFVLKALSNYTRYLTPFPRVAEAFLKSMTSLWSAPLDASENYQVVRVHAFLRIRQLALTQPYPFIEDCLKKTYLAYAKRSKFGGSSQQSLPTLTFMGNCLVELYGLDFDSSYQHAFVYIRQLALLLRTALQKKTPEALQQVYCWQYIHCLKLWVAVLSMASPADDGLQMRSLVYPLTEIILGTVRLVPSPVRHLPLRFHCIRLLQQLAASTEVFIPTTSLLLDCLEWKEWSLSPKKSKARALTRGVQLNSILKFSKDDPLRTHEQLEAAANEFFLLLQREIELYRYSAGFPEFAIRIVTRLRQFSRETRNPRFRAHAKSCLDVCDKYSKFAVMARTKLNEAPKDVTLLECLKPISEKSMRQRHESAVEKENAALEATRLSSVLSSTSHSKNTDEASVGDDSADTSKDSTDTEQPKKKRPNKSTVPKKKAPISRSVLEKQIMDDHELMGQQDEVDEGVNWLDDL